MRRRQFKRLPAMRILVAGNAFGTELMALSMLAAPGEYSIVM
jgi:hypothetical protein